MIKLMTKKVLIIGDDRDEGIQEILESLLMRCQDLDIEIEVVDEYPYDSIYLPNMDIINE